CSALPRASPQVCSALPRYSSAHAPAADFKSSAALRACSLLLCNLFCASPVAGGVCSPVLFSSAIGSLQLFVIDYPRALVNRQTVSCRYKGKRVSGLKRSCSCELSAVQAFTEAKRRKSLFAENDSRLCQIVWRKLYRNFVARYNPDEMLAHFARTMGT